MNRHINPNTLSIVKDLLIYFDESVKDEEGFFIYNIWYWKYLSNWVLMRILYNLVNDDVITKVKVNLMKVDASDEVTSEVVKTLKIDKKSLIAEDVEIIIPQSVYESKKEVPHFWFYTSKAKLQKYIDGYLDDWINEELYIDDVNIYKPSVQLKKVVQYLLKLLNDYSSKYLLVHAINDDQVDFAATILFLEKAGFIEVDSLGLSERKLFSDKVLAFRINVLSLFKEKFKSGVEYNDDYYHFIINDDELENTRITFGSSKELRHKGSVRSLKGGNSLPIQVLSLAARSKDYSVNMEVLKEVTGEDSDDRVHKALNNFRQSLRKDFELSDDLIMFEITKDGEIVFDREVFYFEPISARLS